MGMKKKKILMAMAGAALVLGTSVIVEAPASAAPSCPSGRVCMWENANFGGSEWTTAPAYGCYNFPYAWEKNIMSSVYNNTAYSISFYDGDNCTGVTLGGYVNGGAYLNAGSLINDRANSFRRFNS
jgi:hypothetical protein